MGLPTIKYYDVPTDVPLSRAPLPWRLDPEKAALLVHDMQNYFLRPYESNLFVQKIITHIDAIKKKCHSLDIPTFYTAQPGGQTKINRGLLVDLWGPGMPDDQEAQAIVRGLEPTRGKDIVLVKHRYSAFAKSDLLDLMKEHRRTQLIVCGVYAHIGCLVTATEAFMADIQPFLVADALGDFSLEHHEMALRHAAHCSGRVLSSEQVLEELD